MSASIPYMMYKVIENPSTQKPLKSSLNLMKPGDITFVRYKEGTKYKLGFIYMTLNNMILIIDTGFSTKSKKDILWTRSNFNMNETNAFKMSTETNEKLVKLEKLYKDHKSKKNINLVNTLQKSYVFASGYMFKNKNFFRMKKDGSLFKTPVQIEEIIFLRQNAL